MIKKLVPIFALAMIFALACGAWAQPKAVPVASDIMGVTGIGFDDQGNLYTKGNVKEGNTFHRILWVIDGSGNRTKFAEITDKGDKLAAVGIAYHSQSINGLVVDGDNNIWLTSAQPCACFVVSPDKNVVKVYVNTSYTLGLDLESNYPHGAPYGAAWDAGSKSLYLVTTGPETGRSAFSINVNRLPQDFASKLARSNVLQFIPNTGWPVRDQSIQGLFTGNGAPLYSCWGNSLYKIDENGAASKFGPDIPKGFIKSGVIDEKGGMYIAANVFLGKSSEDPIDTMVYSVSKDGKKSLYFKTRGYCTGMAYRGGYIYLTDSKQGVIYKIKAK